MFASLHPGWLTDEGAVYSVCVGRVGDQAADVNLHHPCLFFLTQVWNSNPVILANPWVYLQDNLERN